jgi:choline dehydrogenase-like flavoprotein
MAEKIYDVIIVGAGVAGALCAWKLASAGKKVLILEAADQPTGWAQRDEFREVMVADAADAKTNIPRGDQSSPYLALASRRYAPSPELVGKKDKDGKPIEKYYDYDLTGPQTEMFKAGYVRLVGGSTWAWRGNTPRKVPNDFRLKSTYGVGEDWPISYDDLEPWYVEAEYELGVAGNDQEWNGLLGGYRSKPFPMREIPLSYGDKLVKKELDGTEIDGVKITVRSTPQARLTIPYKPHEGFHERRACEGNSNCIPLCPSSAKYDAGSHVKAAVKTGNADLRSAGVVTELMVNGGGENRVTAVRYKNWRSANKDEHQTASANVVILAANAIETPKLLLMSNLANSSDQVGRNLMDHLQDEVTAFFPNPLYPFRGPQSTCSIEDFRDGPFRKNYSAFRMTIGNDGHGRARSPINVMDDYLDNQILFGEGLRSKLANDIPKMMRISFSTELLPNPNNRVTLSDKLDSYGLPRPRIHFEVDSYTYDALKKGHEVALTLLESVPNIEKDKIKEREWQRKWNTAAHIMGTCRMGNDPKTSVVNTDGQTYDHPNLYIVGTSVFPTSATANPTLTAAALALKTASAVLSKLGGKGK